MKWDAQKDSDRAATFLPPWIERPFRFITWLDMLEFSARQFYQIGVQLQVMIQVAERYPPEAKLENTELVKKILVEIHDLCAPIGLKQSAYLAKYFSSIIAPEWSVEELKARIQTLDAIICNETRSELFLWVSTERASYYNKTAEELLGSQCLDRFKDSRIDREATEAMRCYALGRFTACAFHVTRIGEAAVRAFAISIGYVVKNHNWGGVFAEYDAQYSLKPQDRPVHWQIHGDFLIEISGGLKAMQKAWRNGVVHLDASYNADEAEYLLRVVPVFVRHVATRLDERGVLYPA